MTRDQIFQENVQKLMYRLESVRRKSNLLPNGTLDALSQSVAWMDSMVTVAMEHEGIPMFDGILIAQPNKPKPWWRIW